jgi:type I restriction enzyme R subunit
MKATGKVTYFRDSRDPDSRSRRVFAFHKPDTLQEWISQKETLRGRLKQMPPLITEGLRRCQKDAIVNLEESFAAGRPRALIQMATGSGKTFAAVSFVYRLIKFAGARKVLFLVDRNNLGRQTFKEFQQYRTPDDNRLFTELYNIQHLTSNNLDPVSKVYISTIQRIYSMLSGEEVDEEAEEYSLFEDVQSAGRPKTVVYNPKIPIETFDFIITDECHRSIYNLWRQVLEYFDSFLIGLTATPSKQTLGFFHKNLVMEYSHDRAVADGVNVGYEVYRINTKISQKGSKVKAGFHIDKRDKLTRERRWEPRAHCGTTVSKTETPIATDRVLSISFKNWKTGNGKREDLVLLSNCAFCTRTLLLQQPLSQLLLPQTHIRLVFRYLCFLAFLQFLRVQQRSTLKSDQYCTLSTRSGPCSFQPLPIRRVFCSSTST